MEQLHLTELIDREILQRLQDSFSVTSGISTGVSDANGVAVTEHRSVCEFCSKYTKGSEEGLRRCQRCDRRGGREAMETGKPVIYTCHAGLTDFAAPIILEGQFLGCFLGGQVLTEPLSPDRVRSYAEELGIPPEEYIKAAADIPVVPRERIESLADFLYNTCDMISHMAYQQHASQQKGSELEKEAHMKSDFLANMSHEIRTPMNAVIGMAEMALREELPTAAREYIKQIMASGKTLLTIINDILDFSKIESGKMNINLAEYELFSVVQEIANVIMTRIGDKDLEFVVDVAPDIPRQLMGDSIRIRQIIMNLANNAVKFTREGVVSLTIGYEKISERQILLKVSVQDTGIGIKKEDLGKLFQSFQQVDSKRNRNIEGTGLGLAISKQLVTLMNGSIWVESEYGEGSCFAFEIPQFVINDAPLVEVSKTNSEVVGVLCDNPYIVDRMKKILEQLQVECVVMDNATDLSVLEEKKVEFFFFGSSSYTLEVQDYMTSHPMLTGVLIIDYKEHLPAGPENVLVIRKPLYVMNVAKILNHEGVYKEEDDEEEQIFQFVAPKAEILIVDDNELNLTVAEGILKPLQMKVDKAISGNRAIEMIENKHYDLILMDHMMPELDGIETTHIIRRFHEEYNNVPIIALTANVMEEMQAVFLMEGMNDFVAKPIEASVIVAKIRQWLPPEKIEMIEGKVISQEDSDEELRQKAEEINIPELDVFQALRLAGSEGLFWQILQEYARVIPKKSQLIQQKKEEQDWKNYTIEVHALKSASRQVGAIELSELAAEMEKAGKEDNISFILEHHEELMRQYLAYGPILAKYIEIPEEKKIVKSGYDQDKVLQCMEGMQEAIDNLDMDAMDEVIGQLEGIALQEQEEQLFLEMREAVQDVDVEACENIIRAWKDLLSGVS